MDRQVERTESSKREKADEKVHWGSAHLMCQTPLWGVAGFVGCEYLAWISYSHIRRNEFDWPHDFWTAATYLVWIIVLAGVALDAHCLRERLFFSLLVLNFVAGFMLTLWSTIMPEEVRVARMFTGTLWVLAGLASLTTLGRSKESR